MWTDTHCHLDDEAFRDDLPAVVSASVEAGVTRMIAPGVTPESSRECVRLAGTWPGVVYAAVALHPNSVTEAAGDWRDPEAEFRRIFDPMAREPGVVAIGETGLDLYWHDTPLDAQRLFLRFHLDLARRVGRPMVLHCRDAEAELLDVLREDFDRRGPVPGVVHSFSGGCGFLEECLALGLSISYSGAVTFTNRKFEALRETVARVPADRILLETDSPYLTPMPHRGRVARNTPQYVVHTGALVAELRGVPESQLAAQTSANAERLFFAGQSADPPQ